MRNENHSIPRGRQLPERYLREPDANRASRREWSTHSACRAITISAVVALATSLGGCSISKTVALENDSDALDASLTQPMKAEGIDSTDAELIKSTVAGAGDQAPSNMLAWSNPDTGNRGTIMAIDRFVGRNGEQCRKFQTTVDSFTGISVYNGETCEMEKGSWVLSGFARD